MQAIVGITGLLIIGVDFKKQIAERVIGIAQLAFAAICNPKAGTIKLVILRGLRQLTTAVVLIIGAAYLLRILLRNPALQLT